MQDFPTLSVIIPAYNERLTIRKLLERVRSVPIPKQIVIVDDCSTDGTRDIIKEIVAAGSDAQNAIHAILFERNQGKGAAIRAAIPHLIGAITVIQDADLEYNPAEYPALIAPIVDGRASVVYGSRFLGATHRVLMFRHSVGNKLLTFLSNVCTDLNLTDMETCYKVFRTDVLKRLSLVSNRFGIEPEITAKVARLGCPIYEVPISYDGREYWEGKKIGWRDVVPAVWTILKYAVVDDRDNADAGYTTLRRLRHARRYNEWMWSQFAPYVGERILEVGCGIGNFTHYMRSRSRVVVTDNNEHYLERLRHNFADADNIEVRRVDWSDPSLSGLAGQRFDTIVCFNVLEHIQKDDAALATFASLLEPGGRLLLQVPAMRKLYGELDRALDHFRRYEREELVAKLSGSGFNVDEASYVNVPGMVGWYLNAVVLKRRTVPGLQARIANLLVPWLRLERRWQPRWGMGLLAIARKTGALDRPMPFVAPSIAAH